VQLEAHIALVRVLVEVVDSIRIEGRRTPLDAVHTVTLGQQKLRQVGSILSGDPGYQRRLRQVILHALELSEQAPLIRSNLTRFEWRGIWTTPP
jgi:hypothetical protein